MYSLTLKTLLLESPAIKKLYAFISANLRDDQVEVDGIEEGGGGGGADKNVDVY